MDVVWMGLVVVATQAAAPRPTSTPTASAEPAVVATAVAPTVAAPAVEPSTPPAATPWSFIVISDLHTPNDGSVSPALQRLVGAVIAERPRFVIVAGDSTNGNPTDSPGRVRMATRWWDAMRETLMPLRRAGIPVLPVAGNHDAYRRGHREAYRAAFADLAAWAAPLTIQSSGGDALDAAPFSYAVDVDGVHLALTHIVEQVLAPEVAAWLAADLASTQAPVRIVVGHVPFASVMSERVLPLRARLGRLLAAGGADLYIAGHEHLVWDEDVRTPDGTLVRQVVVGTAHGTYNFGPASPARARASCATSRGTGTRCLMPRGGTRFGLRRSWRGGMIQHHRQTFTRFTVDGEHIAATPMTLDAAGRAVPFALE
jgi:3',5'-cyclic AMP phosphodiesterase CpdA